MISDVERLHRSNYVLITTFRRDGTPVPTPVWAARDGDELIIWTRSEAGKVKRIRRSPRVELSECDARGRPRGEPVTGTARILDAEGTERGRRVLTRKYGLTGRIVIGSSKRFRGAHGSLCLAITVTARKQAPQAG
ncbi:PPOX class F420-dependent enzyme [Actinophytocola xinjiangensis]|uniref:PPOX class F420-dependent enzyme n=1 Tax=Actinophytocola xinjiangensis TaxID=485602 RepID=A0A7Z0WDJ0_9PSEU|nr:PPOX class F420-dependent oxidoreductase [Actinophytocola xinjiangensis]OLF04868.1 PPOX class F420-dependent enzyme [Actinophytocola xinjiangensis]